MPSPSRIVADRREVRSGVPSLLRSMGVKVEYQTLAIGDYVVTSGYVVERKTVTDFVNSLFTGRLFDQLNRLTEHYEEPLIIVEGDLPEALQQLPNPRSIWGAMTTLILDYDSHILFTGDRKETADLLYVLASREGRKKVRPLIYRKARTRTIEEARLNILGNLPGIGPILAERLLAHFGTLRKALAASAAELTMVDGVGRVKADGIVRILDAAHTTEDHEASQAKLEG